LKRIFQVRLLSSLEENYRSTGNILKLANTAIKKNTVRKDKESFHTQGRRREDRHYASMGRSGEAEMIAEKCKELIAKGWTEQRLLFCIVRISNRAFWKKPSSAPM
jgi:superfamily I DNA/RNA helicase